MPSRRMRYAAISLLATLVFVMPVGKAQAQAVNDFFVKSELYVWNRFSDFLEIFRGGVAIGPALGAEFALTDAVQIGAYTSSEKGVTFPHFFPPLWVVPWLEDEPIFTPHEGKYRTWSFFGWGNETTQRHDVRFPRSPWDLRAQLALGVVHGYMNMHMDETGDFFAGIVGQDPMKDDESLDPNARREPARQLGRGLTNIVTAIYEIPRNLDRVTKDQGGHAGISVGLFQGIWRFGIRELTGWLEVATFPMGWQPIIEPEFPFEPAKSTSWRVNPPSFRKNF